MVSWSCKLSNKYCSNARKILEIILNSIVKKLPNTKDFNVKYKNNSENDSKNKYKCINEALKWTKEEKIAEKI